MVTVSYAPPATNALQDAGGNRVAAFTDIMVRNDLPAGAPPAITLTADPASVGEGAGATTITVTAATLDGGAVSIVANSLALAGGATIRNASGLDAVLTHRALADDPGHRVNVAPVLVGARILPGQTPYLILKFDEALDRASQPGTSAFTVTINDQTRSLTHTAFTTGSNNEFTVFLQPTQVDVVHGDKVTVSYVPPAANGLQDAAETASWRSRRSG